MKGEDYEPFGEEWRAHVLRMNKGDIVSLMASMGKNLQAQMAEREARIDELETAMIGVIRFNNSFSIGEMAKVLTRSKSVTE